MTIVKTYQMVVVHYVDMAANSLVLMCTHKEIIDDLFSAIKVQIPSARISNRPPPKTYVIDHLQNRDSEMTGWAIMWLCDNSFEPFAVQSDRLYFRREIEKP